ncbi:DUF4167 domain-containing protein [Candidatus Gromoviella agglomerans]|uniref:DUF4167 domain-containing protein n=1 Tax=Candidatus Gromoviella agglomerans TaxID=2806609 RepID=UPI001E297B30|nr:DUF4167 domain-containing protein [Candidatus Gromoviella agglomerans]UFX98235.1 DUF4167 domain-containing protein [Candidatus Gromoviella agglomerans]
MEKNTYNKQNNSNNSQSTSNKVDQLRNMYKKYSNLASEAKSNGDLVEFELYSQYLEHYQRILIQNKNTQRNNDMQKKNRLNDTPFNNTNQKNNQQIHVIDQNKNDDLNRNAKEIDTEIDAR